MNFVTTLLQATGPEHKHWWFRDMTLALRDRALLLVGFAGAFRRSELVALDCEDIEETDAGLKIIIRRGKTDQEDEDCPEREYIVDPFGLIRVRVIARYRHAAD